MKTKLIISFFTGLSILCAYTCAQNTSNAQDYSAAKNKENLKGWKMPNNEGSYLMTKEGYTRLNLDLERGELDSMMWHLNPILAEKYWRNDSIPCPLSQTARELGAPVDTFYIYMDYVELFLEIEMFTRTSQIKYRWVPHYKPSFFKKRRATIYNNHDFFDSLDDDYTGEVIFDYDPGTFYQCIVKDKHVKKIFITDFTPKRDERVIDNWE